MEVYRVQDSLVKERTTKRDEIHTLPVPEGIPWAEIVLRVNNLSRGVIARNVH